MRYPCKLLSPLEFFSSAITVGEATNETTPRPRLSALVLFGTTEELVVPGCAFTSAGRKRITKTNCFNMTEYISQQK